MDEISKNSIVELSFAGNLETKIEPIAQIAHNHKEVASLFGIFYYFLYINTIIKFIRFV